VSAPFSDPRFSIVIPCFNEADYVGATLTSLHQQTYTGSYELIVVDNNCTDGTAEIASAHGARVVAEETRGVCFARQKGTEVSAGEIVISADADTTYSTDWLARVDETFGTDESIAAVVGPCRYVGGPLWGRAYARLLFSGVQIVYRMTGRTMYVSATNIAFRKNCWPGYDLALTQGGDELGLMRELRTRGRVVYLHDNPTFTSSRRLTRGLLYGLFVTVIYYYLSAYFLNRMTRRTVIGAAPTYRNDRSVLAARLQGTAVALLTGLLVLMPFSHPRHYIFDKSDAVLDRIHSKISGTAHR
jgi:glycosyltransferase involved in cell wall biosynthesis